MTAPTRAVAHTTATAQELNQLIDLLEGGASMTEAFKLVSSTGENFIIKLADAAGARKISIQDSAGVEVAYIDSDGGANFSSLTPTATLLLPTSTSPAQTTDGQIVWDSDDNLITVGDGASRKTFYYGEALPLKQVAKYTDATQTRSADATFVDVIAAGSPATMSFSIAANEVWQVHYRLRVSFTGTGGAILKITGPAAPTAVKINGLQPLVRLYDAADARVVTQPFPEVTAFATNIAAAAAAADTNANYNTSTNGGFFDVNLFVINGANAGTVTLQIAQNTANGTTVVEIGSTMLATKLA